MSTAGPIIVALDGSELAEGAIPYAQALAKALGASLTLLTVWNGAEQGLAETLPSIAVDIDAAARQHYTEYLQGARDRLAPGAAVELRTGEAGDEIIAMAKAAGARAVAIATHGRSGIGRWLAGSTATHLIRHAQTPLLAVGPHALQNQGTNVTLKHLMVPLDGNALSEKALPAADEIAGATGARVSLVRGLQWAVQSYPYTLPEPYVPQIDEELAKAAKAYLRTKEQDVKRAKVDAFVVRGAVADGLIEFIDKEAIDLVVMTTHARGGLARAALGSVADRLIQGSAPVLLIRPD